ncbi:tryptase-2-like [Acanthochromis polyacanthus]|uniref:Tryptase-2-like n=1 Tax=Acanthochromis polyacanthus TaxID=80966 RepID=A0A3Q1EQD5_9TELE|nr:tryptase-2-like [Acanthochromis polyacanthus]
MVFCRLLPVLVLIYNTEAVLGAEVRTSIIGGRNAVKGSWPWMVHISMTTEDGKTKWRCGGTLVGSDWVLTSAQCLDSRLQPYLHRSMVWVGSYQLQKASARYMAISTFVRHRDYQATSDGYVNDIALIKLKKKVKISNDVALVQLPSADDVFGPSSDCWIIGWGQIGNGVPLPNPETLQELKIPIMNEATCKTMYPQLTSNMLCAGVSTGGKDACKGDNGGPLVCRTAKGFVQVGIMSSEDCGRPGRPGIYTRVSKYLSFINGYIKQSEEASAEV